MSKTENKDGAQSAPPKGMWESFLDEIGPEPEGILEGLIASIGRPGVNPVSLHNVVQTLVDFANGIDRA
eukprot:m.43299 g.43299  ORF g.43299 m.43299 type:complete len:69 (+) comp9964_c0_seq2:77-283(+)